MFFVFKISMAVTGPSLSVSVLGSVYDNPQNAHWDFT